MDKVIHIKCISVDKRVKLSTGSNFRTSVRWLLGLPNVGGWVGLTLDVRLCSHVRIRVSVRIRIRVRMASASNERSVTYVTESGVERPGVAAIVVLNEATEQSPSRPGCRLGRARPSSPEAARSDTHSPQDSQVCPIG